MISGQMHFHEIKFIEWEHIHQPIELQISKLIMLYIGNNFLVVKIEVQKLTQ
jgi:hypothetical protein